MAVINRTGNYITYEQMNLINDFRALWTDVILWLRSYMVSVITGFSDIDAIRNRIRRISDEMQQMLEPFLGTNRSEQFQQLFSQYLLHAEEIINALKNNDQQAADIAAVALYKDADAMADFLAGVNPYWSKSQWQNLFYQLTEMGISEIIALYSNQFDLEINIRKRMLKLALVLGDYMAGGVMHNLSPIRPQNINKNQNQNTYITYGQMNLINDFRAIWTELIIWLRSYMVSIKTGFSNLESISNQLNLKPDELRSKLQSFLSIEESEQIQHLLSLYLYRTQELITAKQRNDQQAVATNMSFLYRDVDQLADFLASINPYWSKDQWQNLFYQLTDLWLAQLEALYSGNYELEIILRDRLLKLAQVLGDYMASGIMHYLDPSIVQ